MGLISGLLTLPLAPVRGVVWIAERLEEQASDQLYDESAIRTQLLELERERESGLYDEQEIAAAEDALIERLMTIRALREGGSDARHH